MFKNEDFQGFFAPPADYQTEEILLFSYSLNLVILDELIRKSEIFSFKNNSSDLEKELSRVSQKVTCFVQSDRRAGELKGTPSTEYAYQLFLRGSVKTVPHDKANTKSFHPKLWAILFREKNDENRYLLRLVISSRNLSKQNMLEGAIFLETDFFESQTYESNTDLTQMMEDIGYDPQNTLYKKIASANFSNCISAILPEGLTLQKYKICTNMHSENNQVIGLQGLFPKEYTKFTCVSPFLGKDMMNAVMCANKDNLLITRKNANTQEINYICKSKNCETYYIYDKKNEIEASESEISAFEKDEMPLHAKIYGFDCENNRSSLFIGSANFSDRGLGAEQNHELMLMINGEYKDKGFAQLLRDDFNNVGKIEKIVETEGEDFPEGKTFEHGMTKEQVDKALKESIGRILNNHESECNWKVLNAVFEVMPKTGEKVVDYAFRVMKTATEEEILSIVQRAQKVGISELDCSEHVKEMIRELINLGNIIK